jgi:hypothetical protein
MAKYGDVHKIADLLADAMPHGRNVDTQARYFHSVVALFKALDLAQAQNNWVTLSVHAGDGIWVNYKGRSVFFIRPAQKFVRVLIRKKHPDESARLAATLDAQRKPNVIARHDGEKSYLQWHVWEAGFKVLQGFVLELPVMSDADLIYAKAGHPKYFLGHVRQAALEAFEQDGRICPGVERPSHKVDLTVERIEFDHILPDARGGSRSALNIQVLCQDCNRRKRDTAR